MMTVYEKARARLLLKHLFFATLVLSTQFEANKKYKTAATDMVKVYYNPEFIESLPVDVAIFVIVHEIMHIILKHGLRRRGRRPKQWNIACDHAINIQLKKAGLAIWANCYCDMKYDGMSAEQIYDILEAERNQRGGKPDDRDVEGGIGEDIIEPDDLTDEEIKQIENRIEQQVAQAASMARAAGQMPAGMDIVVEGLLYPPLPWQALLQEYMLRLVHDDESWSRRNRRFHHVVLPSRWSVGMGELVVVGDTSGSMMMDSIFAQIANELNTINEQTKPERVRVIWADDTEVAHEEIFEPGEEVVLHPKGGGGTDMRKPLRYVEKYDPAVVVLITDGYTPWPSEDELTYPLIVCCTTDVACPVGNVVRMTVK